MCSGSAAILRLNNLVEFLRTHYILKFEKLIAFFEYKEITFELFLVFFNLISSLI